MTKMQDLPALGKSGQAVSADPKQLLKGVYDMFATGSAVGRRWPAVYDIEGMPLEEVRSMSVAGTVFEPIDEHLKKAGVPSDGSVGGVMDALNLSHEDVHNLSCECNSAEVNSQLAAYRLNIIRNDDQGWLEL